GGPGIGSREGSQEGGGGGGAGSERAVSVIRCCAKLVRHSMVVDSVQVLKLGLRAWHMVIEAFNTLQEAADVYPEGTIATVHAPLDPPVLFSPQHMGPGQEPGPGPAPVPGLGLWSGGGTKVTSGLGLGRGRGGGHVE
ncbi:unnamed protein product, partial [Discosporangium mesarthrocarpum]